MKNLIFVAGLLAAQFAMAGVETHGGQVVVCPGQPTVLLDYYQATLPTPAGKPQLVDLSKMSSSDVITAFQDRLLGSIPSYDFQQALKILDPTNWEGAKLVPVPDSDPAFELPPGCSLQQVAARQDQTIFYDPDLYQSLTPAQQGLLYAHEALYYMAEQKGMDSSVEVRVIIRNLLMQDVVADELALAQSFREMGYMYFWWEFYTGYIYKRDTTGNPAVKEGELVSLQLAKDPLDDGLRIRFAGQKYTQQGGPSSIFGYLTCDLAGGIQTCTTVSNDPSCKLNYFAKSDASPTATAIVRISCGGQNPVKFTGSATTGQPGYPPLSN